MKIAGLHVLTEAEYSASMTIARQQSPPPPPPITLRAEASGDLFSLIAAVVEWRDSRQPLIDPPEREQTEEARQERTTMWGRYSKAETVLMAVARQCGRVPMFGGAREGNAP